jgi:hypothetical protein
VNEGVGSGIFIWNFNGLSRLLEGCNWQNKILYSLLKRIKLLLSDLFAKEKEKLQSSKKRFRWLTINFHLATRDYEGLKID